MLDPIYIGMFLRQLISKSVLDKKYYGRYRFRIAYQHKNWNSGWIWKSGPQLAQKVLVHAVKTMLMLVVYPFLASDGTGSWQDQNVANWRYHVPPRSLFLRNWVSIFKFDALIPALGLQGREGSCCDPLGLWRRVLAWYGAAHVQLEQLPLFFVMDVSQLGKWQGM